MSSHRSKPAVAADRRVLIVDDDPRVRAALGELVRASEGFELAATAGGAREALAADDALDATVALVDVLLPSAEEGLELIHTLAARGGCVVATSVSGATREPALAAGAARFVEKGPDPQALLSALR